jgi:hypothetical protein
MARAWRMVLRGRSTDIDPVGRGRTLRISVRWA